MTIELILELDLHKLTDYAGAVDTLRTAWIELHRPTDKAGLLKVLKKTMDSCNKKNIHYPRVFLLRKGQLTRGEFKPFIERFAPPPTPAEIMAYRASPEGKAATAAFHKEVEAIAEAERKKLASGGKRA
jgi:hypothetical protein